MAFGSRFGTDVRRPALIVVRGAVNSYLAFQETCGRPLMELKRRAGMRKSSPHAPRVVATWAPGERRTLEIGSCIVLSALGLGFQVGSWPFWSAPVAVGGYLTWVVLYSEATVQTGRLRAAGRWPTWSGRLSSSSEAPPA